MPRGSKKKNGKPLPLPSSEPDEVEWIPAHVRARQQRNTERKPTGRHEDDLSAPLDVTHSNERLLRALAAVAYFDPRRLTYEDGVPRPVSELDDDTATALMGLEVQEIWGPGAEQQREIIGVTKKYKQTDRMRALEILAKVPDKSGKRLIEEASAEQQKDKLAHMDRMVRAPLEHELKKGKK